MRLSTVLPPLVLLAAAFVLPACSAGGGAGAPPSESAMTQPPKDPAPSAAPGATPAAGEHAESPAPPKSETATFAAGCFWCIEAVFEQLPGVLDARSGFMGGTTANPTYAQVCEGDTGHAEVVQVTFDPARVSYAKLLEWFWKSHDPTTLNRQGPDVGTQYRSAVFFHSEEQRRVAEASKAEAQAEFRSPIVTEITKAGTFTEAEDYHQDYYRLNGSQPYCRTMIAPKLHKLGLDE